jgi:hypothetical protein
VVRKQVWFLSLRNCSTYWLIACDDWWPCALPCAWCFAQKMHWDVHAYVLVGC